MKQMLIFGAGYSGRQIAREALASNRFDKVYGTTRSNDKFAAFEQIGIAPLIFGGALTSEILAALADTTHLVLSIAPDDAGDPVFELLSDNLVELAPKLEAITYLSTVGVYGDHNGAWVDETTLCKPVSTRSVARCHAENSWLTLAKDTKIPLSIQRLSGIYGPGRNQIKTALEGKARQLIKPDQVFNRIRVEDIARASLFLLEDRANGIFNVTDDEPAPPQDVVAFACQLAGVELPDPIDFETADLTPMARSFYGENKRVSNSKIKQLGFSFLFSNYRVSLQNLWNNKSVQTKI